MDKYSVIIKYLLFSAILICLLNSLIHIEIDGIGKSEQINIEIKGEVENDVVLTVNRGDSLNDVLDEIELKDDADLSTVSLLKPLKDNEIIVIPKSKEDNLVSINSADLNDLCSLPGIGESIASRIIDYRELNGSFLNLEEIMNVKGIGEKKFEKIKDLICL